MKKPEWNRGEPPPSPIWGTEAFVSDLPAVLALSKKGIGRPSLRFPEEQTIGLVRSTSALFRDGRGVLSPIRRVFVMFRKLKEELDAIMERDPAARSRAEVYFLYSGFKAVRAYRKANWFYRRNMKFIARFISQRARHKTGIEIHPGATIGERAVHRPRHGRGHRETTEIGDNCTIYQNVTLGGTGKDHGKRHPRWATTCWWAPGAKLLGPFKAGGQRPHRGGRGGTQVPPTAVAPARVVRINGMKTSSLDQIHVTDPVAQELCRLQHTRCSCKAGFPAG